MDSNLITLHGKAIGLGETRAVDYPVGSLPSGHKIHATVHIYRGMGKGPCLLLLAGMHGDEINGVEILRRCILNGFFSGIPRGTVIVAPLLNVFGFINFSRDLADGKDINRSFPGSVKGSLASRIAFQVTKELLPISDYVIDFHTGGSGRYNYPQVRFSTEDQSSRLFAKTFGAPFLISKPVIEKSLRETASEMGKAVIVYEAGESLRYDPMGIEEGIRGLTRVLDAYFFQKKEKARTGSKELKESTWIRATHAGLFLWAKEAGKPVKKGEILGDIHDPHGRVHHVIKSPKDGWIIGHNNAAVVSLGDALFHIAW